MSFNTVWEPDESHRVGTIAITIVTFDTDSGEILDADVELNQHSTQNPQGYHFATGIPTGREADLATILTHEFGRFHGLAHSDLDNAVMWAYAGLGEQRRNLTSDDAAGICAVYPAAQRPPAVCNPTPYGGLALEASSDLLQGTCRVSPGQLGRPRESPKGHSVFLCLLLSVALRRPGREASMPR